MRESVMSVFRFRNYVLGTQPRILSSVQLQVNQGLFLQSSLYLIKILSSVQLLFKQRFSSISGRCPGEMFGGNVEDPIDLSLSFRLELIPPRGGVSHADPPSPL